MFGKHIPALHGLCMFLFWLFFLSLKHYCFRIRFKSAVDILHIIIINCYYIIIFSPKNANECGFSELGMTR